MSTSIHAVLVRARDHTVGARNGLDKMARTAPARLAIVAFAAVILLFTSFLMLPVATTSHHGASLVTALFTATSAVCVTGLTVVPTALFWSPFGHVVILLGIKIGGLGVMTLASLLALAVSRRIGLTQKLLAATEVKTTRLGEVGGLIRVVVVTSTSIELVIALVLVPRFLTMGQSVGSALWHSLFYSVSAFNNAGFVVTEDGLIPHAHDALLVLPLIVGAFIGSLGFPVILNVVRHRKGLLTGRGRRRLSLHTKLTLVTSGALVLIGGVAFLAMEWSNAGSIGHMGVGTKLVNSLFMGVAPRSVGFSTFDMSQASEPTWLVTDALMFVGGGSASTAGGIRVTTLAVMLLAIFAEARGDRDVEAFGRRIPRDTLRLAVAVVFLAATVVLLASLALLEITGATLDRVLFEAISAFATVGLSTGLTSAMPDAGKVVLILLMFIGRTGIMSFAAALAIRDRRRLIRYPEERPIIG